MKMIKKSVSSKNKWRIPTLIISDFATVVHSYSADMLGGKHILN